MIQATYHKYSLIFKQPSGTSRGILKTKETWFLILKQNEKIGVGECALFRGLSADDRLDYEDKLKWICENINLGFETLIADLNEFPSIQFGLEQAFLSLKSSHSFALFPSEFTESKKSIPINGLIWMGSKDFMLNQIQEKLNSGFTCIKLKIGAIDFESELNLLKSIRKEYSAEEIEIRVDANGAFQINEALEKLKRLSEFKLHSIEQPIKPRHWQEMADLCEKTPLSIALDEELIGVFNVTKKKELLQTINPQYIILKPSLIGGVKGSSDWINEAENNNIGWWITSALESNVGLNAIAQWTFTLDNKMPQGLGTGSLFTNNFESPLKVKRGKLHYIKNDNWNFNIQ